MIRYRAVSDELGQNIGTDEPAFRWEFEWGPLDLQVWFIALFVAFLFLHTVKLVIGELTETVRNTEEDASG